METAISSWNKKAMWRQIKDQFFFLAMFFYKKVQLKKILIMNWYTGLTPLTSRARSNIIISNKILLRQHSLYLTGIWKGCEDECFSISKHKETLYCSLCTYILQERLSETQLKQLRVKHWRWKGILFNVTWSLKTELCCLALLKDSKLLRGTHVEVDKGSRVSTS